MHNPPHNPATPPIAIAQRLASMLTPEQVSAIRISASRISLRAFGAEVSPYLDFTPFHKIYYTILSLFADGKIKNLMVSVPPQHGKSEGSSRLLPAYMLARNPNTRIAVCSYSGGLASSFGEDARAIMREPRFGQIFPNFPGLPSMLKGRPANRDAKAIDRAAMYSLVRTGYKGSIRCVGRGGSLTGNAVDVAILDDLYKDAEEAASPTIRAKTWEWYKRVVRTRLHNTSQTLVVFTRWHEEDVIGMIQGSEEYAEPTTWAELQAALQRKPDIWIKLNWPAIQNKMPTELDPRPLGCALFPARHSLAKLESERALDVGMFESLYQGDPMPAEGLLYGTFKTYTEAPGIDNIAGRYIVADIKDKGTDYLCSIAYVLTLDGLAYVTDVIYTQETGEVTEPLLAQQIFDHDATFASWESNGGGEAFARAVRRYVRDLGGAVRHQKYLIYTYHQARNKEAKILVTAPRVLETVVMPHDWYMRWPTFHNAVTKFRRIFGANKYDDAPDALTECYLDSVKRAHSTVGRKTVKSRMRRSG